MKLYRSVVASFLALAILAPSAQAGVVTKMVEVEPEMRQELEANRVKLEECMDLKEAALDQNGALKSRINQLMQNMNKIKAANQNLQGQLTDLKDSNEEMSRRLAELKASMGKSPAKKARASTVSPAGIIWPVVSTPVGAVTGTVRGAMNKSMEYANRGSEMMGDSLPGQFIGKFGGLVIGNITGAISGLIRGIIDGLVVGYHDPFSAESVSLGGEYASDYDPYDISPND